MTGSSAVRRAPPRLFADGEWRDGASGRTLATEHPATGEVIVEVAIADGRDVDDAVAAALSALLDASWSRVAAGDRSALLWRIADAMETDAERLARVEVADTGKPLREARLDIGESIATFRYYAGWPGRIHGETLPVRGDVLNYTLREPVGVIDAIVPWNFPLLQAAWKVAPALACGNAVVLKPAEQTPPTALELAALATWAGVPPGVLNVLPGDGPVTGDARVRHPGVDAAAERARTLEPGDPFDPGTRLGPLVSGEQRERVLGHVRRGMADGARLLRGGGACAVPGMERGYWVQPTLLDQVDQHVQSAGPGVAIRRREAVRLRARAGGRGDRVLHPGEERMVRSEVRRHAA